MYVRAFLDSGCMSLSYKQRLRRNSGVAPWRCAALMMPLLGIVACRGTEPLACTVRVDSGCWTNLGLDGEVVTSLVQTPLGLFAGTVGHGVFRYVDGHWHNTGLQLPNAYIPSLLYLPTEPPRLLAAIGAWQDMAGQDTRGAVYAMNTFGLWQPWDGGLEAAAWQQGRDAWAYALASDPRDRERLYLGRSYPIMRSDDGGASWRYVWGGDGVDGGGILQIQIDPRVDGELWAVGATLYGHAAILYSPDSGHSWSFTDPTPTTDNTAFAVALDSGGTGRVLVGTAGGVMASPDTGSSWQYVLPSKSARAFASTPAGLYVITGDYGSPGLGLYRTRNGGQSWDTLTVPQLDGGGLAMTTAGSSVLLIATDRVGVWQFEP